MQNSLIFCFLFITNAIINAQIITENSCSFLISDIETGTEREIHQWYINNNTKENVIIWLENDTIIGNMPIGDRVQYYFYSKKGDFSLVDVIFEYGSTLTGVKTDLFYSFYKIIEPQKTFSIQVICKKTNSSIIYSSLRKMIMIATPSQLQKEKFNIFTVSRLELLSFKNDILIIEEQDFLLSCKNTKDKVMLR